MLWTCGLLGAPVKWKTSTRKAFARKRSEPTSWVTVVATDTRTIQGAPELVWSPALLVYICAVILILWLYKHSRSPIVTLVLVLVNSRSDSTLMFVSSSTAFSSGCSAFYRDPRFVCSTSWIFVCLFTSIWHCSNTLLWLLGHHWLHRSAWESFKQSIWDRMQLSLLNLRPGTSVWTSYIEDNGFLFSLCLGLGKKHKKSTALTWVQAIKVAPAENRNQPVCSGNCLKAGRALCARVEGGCTTGASRWGVQASSAASVQTRQSSVDVRGAGCRSPPQRDTCANIREPNFTSLGKRKGPVYDF